MANLFENRCSRTDSANSDVFFRSTLSALSIYSVKINIRYQELNRNVKSPEVLRRLFDWLRRDITDLNTASLVIGAILGIVISAAAGPIITGAVAYGLNDWNVPPYSTPATSISMVGGSGYTVEGESLEEFGGIEYNDTVRLYELQISNPGDQPINDLDVNIPLPGCVVDYTKGGIGSEVRVVDYVSLDLRGQGEGVEVYSCSKTVSVEQLDPGDSVSIRFLLRVSFDQCDLLQGIGTENKMAYNYQWQKNGIRFFESGQIGMGFQQDFREAFQRQNHSIVRGKTIQTKGIAYTNYIVGMNNTSFPQAMGECRLMNG